MHDKEKTMIRFTLPLSLSLLFLPNTLFCSLSFAHSPAHACGQQQGQSTTDVDLVGGIQILIDAELGLTEIRITQGQTVPMISSDLPSTPTVGGSEDVEFFPTRIRMLEKFP